MFSTVFAASGNKSRNRRWWLRDGWTGRPLNFLICLLAGASVALSLLSGAMLLRSGDVVIDDAQPGLATDVDRAMEKLAYWRALKAIFADETGQSPPPVAAMPPNVTDRSQPPSAGTGADTDKNVDQPKQRDSVETPAPKSVTPSQDPGPVFKRDRMTADFLRYLSNQLGELQVDLRDATSRIAVTEDNIRQLQEKSWYDWCSAITALLGQLAGFLAAAFALLKWFGSKSTSPSIA